MELRDIDPDDTGHVVLADPEQVLLGEAEARVQHDITRPEPSGRRELAREVGRGFGVRARGLPVSEVQPQWLLRLREALILRLQHVVAQERVVVLRISLKQKLYLADERTRVREELEARAGDLPHVVQKGHVGRPCTTKPPSQPSVPVQSTSSTGSAVPAKCEPELRAGLFRSQPIGSN